MSRGANPQLFPKVFLDVRALVNGIRQKGTNLANFIELTEWTQYQIDNGLLDIITSVVSPTNFFEIATSAAGSNAIATPTKPFMTVYKTAITGGGDTDTLPDTSTLTIGQNITVKDQSYTAGTNNWTIATFGAELIDGVAELTIDQDGDAYTLQWDGTQFNII